MNLCYRHEKTIDTTSENGNHEAETVDVTDSGLKCNPETEQPPTAMWSILKPIVDCVYKSVCGHADFG